MYEETKVTVDYLSAGITFGAFIQLLPEIAALFTALWMMIRIWESDTIQGIIRKFIRDNKRDS